MTAQTSRGCDAPLCYRTPEGCTNIKILHSGSPSPETTGMSEPLFLSFSVSLHSLSSGAENLNVDLAKVGISTDVIWACIYS